MVSFGFAAVRLFCHFAGSKQSVGLEPYEVCGLGPRFWVQDQASKVPELTSSRMESLDDGILRP